MYEEYPHGETVYNRNQYENVASKDPGFMQWFLQVEGDIKEITSQWRGYEKNQKGEWIETKHSKEYALMNERGVRYCEQILRSCVGRGIQTSNYNDANLNHSILQWIIFPVWGSLEQHYWDFEFKRAIDMEILGSAICRLAHAILLGARANGYRLFLTQTHQISEVKTSNNDDQQRRGMFNALGGIFRRPPSQQMMRGDL